MIEMSGETKIKLYDEAVAIITREADKLEKLSDKQFDSGKIDKNYTAILNQEYALKWALGLLKGEY